MKKWLVLVLAIICIPITLVGCVPTNTPATQTPVVSPVTDLQNWRQTIDNWKATVADPAIAKVNTQSGASNTAQLQSDLASAKSAITQLQSDLTAVTTRLTAAENSIKTMTTVTTSTSTVGTSGAVPQFTPGTLATAIATAPNGQVEQQLNYSSQGNIIYAGTGGSNQLYYTQRFINHNTSQMFVTPKIGLSIGNSSGYAYTPQTVTNITFNISGGNSGFYSYAPIVANYSSTNATANFQISGGTGITYYLVTPGLGTATQSLTITPYYSYYKGLPLGAGQYMDINVQVYGLYCTPGATWTVTPSFDQSL